MSETYSTIEQELSAWAHRAFAEVFPQADLAALPLNVVATAEAVHGDYQCNAAMSAAKLLRQKPRDVAQAIVDNARLPVCVARLEVAGPGFLNFHLSTDWLARKLETFFNPYLLPGSFWKRFCVSHQRSFACVGTGELVTTVANFH